MGRVNLLSPWLWKWLIFWGYFRTTYLKSIVSHHLSSQSCRAFISQSVAFTKVLRLLRCIIHSGKIIFSKIGFLVYVIKSALDWCSWIDGYAMQIPGFVLGNKQLKDLTSAQGNKKPSLFLEGGLYILPQVSLVSGIVFVLLTCYFMR